MSVRAEISVFDIWRIVIRRRAVLVAVWALIFVLAVTFAYVKKPVYRSETVLMVVSGDSPSLPVSALMNQFSSLTSLAGFNPGGSDVRTEALATLRSRAFLEAFIDDNNLLPIFFPDKWDAQAEVWYDDDESSPPTLSKGYEYFANEVMSVIEDRAGELVTVAINTTHREFAAQWANSLVLRLNSRLRERTIEEAKKSIDYLNTELEKTGIVEIQQAIYHLLEQQIQKVMMANVRDEFAFKIIDPAKTPELDSYVAPKRFLILVFGFIGGFFAGLFAAFLVHSLALFRGENAALAA